MDMSTHDRLLVTMLSRFLGAGRTTLLDAGLRDRAGRSVGRAGAGWVSQPRTRRHDARVARAGGRA